MCEYVGCGYVKEVHRESSYLQGRRFQTLKNKIFVEVHSSGWLISSSDIQFVKTVDTSCLVCIVDAKQSKGHSDPLLLTHRPETQVLGRRLADIGCQRLFAVYDYFINLIVPM